MVVQGTRVADVARVGVLAAAMVKTVGIAGAPVMCLSRVTGVKEEAVSFADVVTVEVAKCNPAG